MTDSMLGFDNNNGADEILAQKQADEILRRFEDRLLIQAGVQLAWRAAAAHLDFEKHAYRYPPQKRAEIARRLAELDEFILELAQILDEDDAEDAPDAA